jgi:DNA ligase-1
MCRVNWTPSKTSWAPGTPVPYSALCATFDTISSTTKRLEILSHLTKFYRTVIEITPDNLLQCVYLTINRIAPDYEGLELGIGESLLVKAIAESSGRSVAQVKNDLEKTGDLGDIAQVRALLRIPDIRNPKERNRPCSNRPR